MTENTKIIMIPAQRLHKLIADAAETECSENPPGKWPFNNSFVIRADAPLKYGNQNLNGLMVTSEHGDPCVRSVLLILDNDGWTPTGCSNTGPTPARPPAPAA